MARKTGKQRRTKAATQTNVVTFPELPSAHGARWVAKRKAQVVDAVREGVLTLEEACRRYALTREEFLGWQRAIEKFGLPGLRATHAQEYRAR